jgi:hypothetical protein
MCKYESINNQNRRFKVFMVVAFKLMVFWGITVCHLVGKYQCSGRIYCLHFQGQLGRLFDKAWFTAAHRFDNTFVIEY